MTQAAHTPGPWISEGDLEHGLIVFDPMNKTTVCEVFCIDGDIESEANARLIAAAPDLLKALQAYLKVDEIDLNGEDAREAHPESPLGLARRAIAKAHSGWVRSGDTFVRSLVWEE